MAQPISYQVIAALKAHLAGRKLQIPDGGRIVWGWFLDLCRTRTSNGYGPNPISYVEIEAYARIHRWPLAPRHIDLIMAMDQVWMDHARQLAGGTGAGAAAGWKSSGQAATPEAFDAVFG